MRRDACRAIAAATDLTSYLSERAVIPLTARNPFKDE
jgi:hypothetical protein